MQNMDLWFFWDIFKKKWRIVMFIASVVAIIAGVYSKLFVKPMYSSSVSLYFGRVTESSPIDKAMALTGNEGFTGAASQLALGSQLTGDYRELINFDVITNGVEDELLKMGKWKNLGYEINADPMGASRIMRLIVKSGDPLYCQAVANIYAKVFIDKAPQLVGVENTQIIEEPTPQFKPISPNIPRNILGGFAGGFAISFLFFVAVKVLNRSIKTSREVEAALNLPVVGTIHKDKNYTVDPKSPILFSGDNESEKNRSQIAEDFRVFRVNVINRETEKKEGEGGSVIAVTSPYAKEGKTFCTANLSASLAEAGYKVLLIDCDTGKRGLQSYFGTSSDKGLMNILSDEVDFDSVVKRNLNNLSMDVLFCGNQNVNSANLMISPKFKELVNKLKKQYDYAFLDVSTNIGTADIVSAGSSADSVLLLVRSGKTNNEIAQETIDSLKRANLEVSGVILNGVEEE